MKHNTLPFIPFSEEELTRFWSKVAKAGKTDCWEWQGCRQKPIRNQLPYGWFVRSPVVVSRKEQIMAHRVAMMIHLNGPIPMDGRGKTLCVLHTCHNAGCVNPMHLRLGTHDQNMADRQLAGRFSPPPPNAVGRVYRYLTLEAAKDILDNKLSAKIAVERYGISRHTYYSLRKRGITSQTGKKTYRGGLSRSDTSRYNREQRARIKARNATPNPNLGI